MAIYFSFIHVEMPIPTNYLYESMAIPWEVFGITGKEKEEDVGGVGKYV